jgi:hypothetical protein
MPSTSPAASHSSKVQLQAVSDGRNPCTYTHDKASRGDMDFIQDFCKQALNINPSTSVIVRRALLVYVCHLAEQVLEIQMQTHDGAPRDQLKALEAFIKTERKALFHAAGKEIGN